MLAYQHAQLKTVFISRLTSKAKRMQATVQQKYGINAIARFLKFGLL